MINCSAREIFEGMTKLLKLNIENQFKILVAFFISMNEKFQKDAITIFTAKCNEFHKDPKFDQLSKDTVQHIILLINSVPELKEDNFLKSTFNSYLIIENPIFKEEIDFKEDNLDYIEVTYS